MQDHILDKMNELHADGVDFTPISDSLLKGDYFNCGIICSYTKSEWESGDKSYPKTPYLFYVIHEGKKKYLK